MLHFAQHFAHVRTPRPGWDATAHLIAAASENRAQASTLIVIAWVENTFVTDGSNGVPFGVTCCADHSPRRALGILYAGRAECAARREAWIRYLTGSCRVRVPAHHRETRRHRALRIRAHRYAETGERLYWRALGMF